MRILRFLAVDMNVFIQTRQHFHASQNQPLILRALEERIESVDDRFTDSTRVQMKKREIETLQDPVVLTSEIFRSTSMYSQVSLGSLGRDIALNISSFEFKKKFPKLKTRDIWCFISPQASSQRDLTVSHTLSERYLLSRRHRIVNHRRTFTQTYVLNRSAGSP